MDNNKSLSSLFFLGIPIYFELMSGVICGIIDSFWVAKLGVDQLAAVTIATNLEFVLLAVTLMISTGITILISIKLGENDHIAVKKIIINGWVMGFVISIFICVFGVIFSYRISQFFLAGENFNAIGHADSFFKLMFPGSIIFIARFVIAAIFKGYKNTKVPMMAAIITTIINIILDPILIFGWLGAPQLGVAGAALSTIISRVIAMVWVVIIYTRSDMFKKIKKIKVKGLDFSIINSIFKVGFPVSLEFGIRTMSTMIMIKFIAEFSMADVAAFGIGTKIIFFATMSYYAIRQATSIQVARYFGERAITKIYGVAKAGILLGLYTAVTFIIVLAIFKTPIIRLFTENISVVVSTNTFLYYMLFFLAPLSVSIALSGFFIGIKKSNVLIYVTTCYAATLLTFIFIMLKIFHVVEIIWISMIFAAFVQMIILVIIFFKKNLVIECKVDPIIKTKNALV